MRDDSWVADGFNENEQAELMIDPHISYFPINTETLTQFHGFDMLI